MPLDGESRPLCRRGLRDRGWVPPLCHAAACPTSKVTMCRQKPCALRGRASWLGAFTSLKRTGLGVVALRCGRPFHVPRLAPGRLVLQSCHHLVSGRRLLVEGVKGDSRTAQRGPGRPTWQESRSQPCWVWGPQASAG